MEMGLGSARVFATETVTERVILRISTLEEVRCPLIPWSQASRASAAAVEKLRIAMSRTRDKARDERME